MKKIFPFFLFLISQVASANDTLTLWQVYNFNVGDTFDYRITQTVNLYGNPEITYVRHVLFEKSISAGNDTLYLTFDSGASEPLIITDLNSNAFSTIHNNDTSCQLSYSIDTTTYPGYLSNSVDDDCDFGGYSTYVFTQGLGKTRVDAGGNYNGTYPVVSDTDLIYFSNGVIFIGTPYTLFTGLPPVVNNIPSSVVYPTVAKNELTVISSLSNVRYQVYDVSGNAIMTGVCRDEKTLLDASNLSGCMYFIKIIDQDSQYAVKKFIVQR